jgi:hypothetical protein
MGGDVFTTAATNAALQAGQSSRFPSRSCEPLNFLAQCGHWMMTLVAGTDPTDFGAAAGEEAFGLAAATVDAGTPPAFGFGIEIADLQAGQGICLPASASGALNFLAHRPQATI